MLDSLQKPPRTSRTIFTIFCIGALIFFATLLYYGVIISSQQNMSLEITKKSIFHIKNTLVTVDIARTYSELEKGLSGRASLSDGEGMFFEFSESRPWPFWMKGMNFSIDIIWFDESFKIVGIKQNASPDSYPQTFEPEGNAKYVLEVPAGFVEKWGIKTGDAGFLEQQTF